MLEVSAFGPVRARLDGAVLDLGGPRQRAVLGLLVAAGGRTVSTDRFLEELWSGEPPPSAIGALQAYVSRLRSALEPDREKRRPATVLVSSPPGYALALPTGAVDTWHVDELVRAAAGADDAVAVGLLDEALALWTDEPFVEYAEHEWAAVEAVRLRELRATAVQQRAAAHLRLGEGSRALADLEAHVRDHPLREAPVGLLARAYYQCGRQAEALAALAALRERLVEELGVDPAPELRALESDILLQAAHLAAPVQVTADTVAGAPPLGQPDEIVVDLVGREDELARLAAAARSVGRRAGLVWVEGDAGFGKSALLTRFGDESVGAWSVVRGHCSEVAGAPAGHAWHEVLAALGGPVEAPPGESAFALAATVRRRLEERHARTLVLLDDLHRADDVTLQVLWHAVEATSAPVLVVASFRSHEVGRDLAATLALTTERTLDRIVLGGLTNRDARALLSAYADTTLTEAAWARLVDRSGGNPLFLRQLAQLVASEGAQATEALPAAIRDLLLRRIERLPKATADALSRAAVLGRDLDLDLVLALEEEHGEADEAAVLDHLDAGVVAGLLEAPRPTELRFTHALVRDTCYGRLAPLRRHRLHQAALAAYQRLRPDGLQEMAHHASAALDRRNAAGVLPLLLEAAAHTSDAGAVPHLRAALRALELAPDAGAMREVRRALVGALARDGATTAATAERAIAVAEARRHGDAHDVARAWSWPAPMTWSRSGAEAADPSTVTELRDLLDRIGDDDPALRIEVLNALVVEADPWNVDEVLAASEEAVALAGTIDDPELRCRALNAAHFAVNAHPDPGRLATLGTELLTVAEGAGLHGYAAVAHMQLQADAVARADLAAAAEHIELAVRAGTSGQLPELLLLSSIFAATTRLLQDDLGGARTGFDEVTRQLGAGGDPNEFYIGLWCRFAVDFAAGDTSGLCEDAERMTRQMPWHSTDLWAVTLLDRGDVDRAREVWRAVPLQRDATWLFDAAVRAHLVCELGERDHAAQVRAALLPWSGRLTHTLNGALSMGPVDHYLSRLSHLLGDEPAAHRHDALARRLTGPGGATTWAAGWARDPAAGRT